MEKLTRIRHAMRKKGIEAIFLTDEINIHYATDFSFSDGCVLITLKSAHILTDSRYIEEIGLYVDASRFTVTSISKRAEYIADILRGEDIHSVWYEDISMSCAEFQLWAKNLEISFSPLKNFMLDLREIKDEEELKLMEKAQSITDLAFQHLLGVMTPQMTEIEIALELEFFMRKNGADDVSFPIIAVSGSSSSLPHGKPLNRPLQKGFLTMDFGAKVHGYCSDMTRTISIGRATKEMKHIYQTVLEAQEAGLAAIQANALCREVDAKARNLIECKGYSNKFGHGLGHGVGMYIHESPRLSPLAEDSMLKKGQVVTVEPGIYIEGYCGCRIEDMVTVTERGYDSFTKSQKNLIELFA